MENQNVDWKSKLNVGKFFNDLVYGSIGVTELELKIIETPIFQRLRKLRRLGRVNFVFMELNTLDLFILLVFYIKWD